MLFIKNFWAKRKPHHGSLLLGAFLLLFTLMISWHDSLTIPYVGDHFAYSADLNATDSLYDTAQNRYDGQRYSEASYFIQTTKKSGSTVSLMSQLKTTTSDKSLIGTISRNYSVDAKTGMHINANGSRSASYLFAPRNLAKGQSFTYWHVTYGSPAIMKYAGTQQLFGMKTYVYNADYSHAGRLLQNDISTADVPSGQGLEYAPKLKIWVEPTTGWLIKYQENTTVYYFDKATGERLGPADHFSNNFTEASIRQQVNYAHQLKYQLDFGQEIAPSLVIITMLGVVFWIAVRLSQIRAVPIVVSVTAALALSGANVAGWLFHIDTLITLFEPGVVVNALASICFMAAAISILLLYKQRYRRAAIGLCSAVCIAMFLQALGVLHIIPFYFDTILFHKSVVDVGANTPDHISLFGTLVLFILAGATLRALTARTNMRRYAPRLAAGIIISLGIAGILAKLFLLDQIFVNYSIANLSIGGLAVCILSGLALMQAVLTSSYEPETMVQYLRALVQPALITIPLILIGVVSQLQQNHVTHLLQTRFDSDVNVLQTTLIKTTRSYTALLLGAQTLFRASHFVEAGEWSTYVSSLDLAANYPGVQSVGYARVLNKTGDGGNVWTSAMFPVSANTTIAPVTYVEPLNAQTQHAVNYDMYTDPVLASAMHTAVALNAPAMTSKVNLLQETNSPDTNGFLVFVPIYANDMPTATLFERQAALQGYVYAAFDASAYFAAALGDRQLPIHVTAYDGFTTDDSALLLYGNGADSVPVDASQPRQTKSTTITVDGHPWSINYISRASFRLNNLEETAPGIILFAGGILYLVAIDTYLWLKALTRMMPKGRVAQRLGRPLLQRARTIKTNGKSKK